MKKILITLMLSTMLIFLGFAMVGCDCGGTSTSYYNFSLENEHSELVKFTPLYENQKGGSKIKKNDEIKFTLTMSNSAKCNKICVKINEVMYEYNKADVLEENTILTYTTGVCATEDLKMKIFGLDTAEVTFTFPNYKGGMFGDEDITFEKTHILKYNSHSPRPYVEDEPINVGDCVLLKVTAPEGYSFNTDSFQMKLIGTTPGSTSETQFEPENSGLGNINYYYINDIKKSYTLEFSSTNGNVVSLGIINNVVNFKVSNIYYAIQSESYPSVESLEIPYGSSFIFRFLDYSGGYLKLTEDEYSVTIGDVEYTATKSSSLLNTYEITNITNGGNLEIHNIPTNANTSYENITPKGGSTSTKTCDYKGMVNIVNNRYPMPDGRTFDWIRDINFTNNTDENVSQGLISDYVFDEAPQQRYYNMLRFYGKYVVGSFGYSYSKFSFYIGNSANIDTNDEATYLKKYEIVGKYQFTSIITHQLEWAIYSIREQVFCVNFYEKDNLFYLNYNIFNVDDSSSSMIQEGDEILLEGVNSLEEIYIMPVVDYTPMNREITLNYCDWKYYRGIVVNNTHPLNECEMVKSITYDEASQHVIIDTYAYGIIELGNIISEIVEGERKYYFKAQELTLTQTQPFSDTTNNISPSFALQYGKMGYSFVTQRSPWGREVKSDGKFTMDITYAQGQTELCAFYIFFPY